jgi:hypothetical protein
MHVESLFSPEWTAPLLLLTREDSTTGAVSRDVIVYNKRFIMNGKHNELN